MSARSLGFVSALLGGLSACASPSANVQIAAATQAMGASQSRARTCAPELLEAAEAALVKARELEAAGEVERARSLAGQAEALARQAEAASPPGCEDRERPSGGGDSELTRPQLTAPTASEAALSLDDLEAALDTIYFDYNLAVITEDSKAVLSKVASILRRFPSASLEIEGHCDVRGSTEYNLHLGERRARSVMKYLVTQGVNPTQIRIISYGEERPVDFGFEEAAHAANRRAELRRL